MNKEEKFLIDLCYAYINNEQINVPNNIDWKNLYNFAKAHNLLAVCHCAIYNSVNKELIDSDFQKALLNSFLDLVFIHECQMNVQKELKELLASSQTPYILFKGAKLKTMYPNAESRVMGDIDILIEPNKRDLVKKALINAGYTCTAQNGPVYNYTKDNVLVEVHTKLISDYNCKTFSEPFKYAKFDNFEGCFDNSFHFAYLIAHTAHHFKFYGAGIKLVLDLAVMQKKTSIDFDLVFAYLRDVNLETFGKVILSVCNKWFGVGESYVEDTSKTEEYLCHSGAFGASNDTSAVITRKELEKGNSTSPLKLKLKLAFPSYKKMKEIDYIKFIDGRPWLTPYAWCYRLIYNLKNRKEFMTNAINSLGDEKTNAKAQQELEYFQEIGLV